MRSRFGSFEKLWIMKGRPQWEWNAGIFESVMKGSLRIMMKRIKANVQLLWGTA